MLSKKLIGMLVHELTLQGKDPDLRLKEAVFKLRHGDGIFAYAIYRPIVYVLMKMLKSKKMSPNKITILAMVLYILAGLILIIEYGLQELAAISLLSFLSRILFLQNILRSKYILGLDVGSILFLLLYNLALILDCMDGSVARYFGITSDIGRVLDSFSDSVGHIVIMIGLIFMLPRYVILISLVFLVYYSLSLTHLSYKFERLKSGKILSDEVRPVFKIGEFKILIGTLDYFIMTINGIFIMPLLGVEESIYLFLVNMFWGALFIGYVIGVAVLRIEPSN